MSPNYISQWSDTVYKLKRSGPKMDPWGTPQIIGATDEENLPNSTEKVLSLIYELNHCKAIPPIPNKRSNRQRRILWSTVSKAAVRSRSRSTVFLQLSTASKMSLNTLSKADSVLCCAEKPDWRGSVNLASFKKEINCEYTTFSKSFDKNESLETGR